MLRAYFVLIMSLTSFGQDSSGLLAVFYPQSSDFYRTLLVGIPAWFIAVTLSFREAIVTSRFAWLFGLVKPSLFLGLVADILVHIDMAFGQQWRFNWSIALSFVFSGLAIFYCVKSRMLNAFIEDWKHFKSPEEENKTPKIS